jgi:hypothetical protein
MALSISDYLRHYFGRALDAKDNLKTSLKEYPGTWVLFFLLCWSTHSCSDAEERLDTVCSLVAEAKEIIIPIPDNDIPILKQVEIPDGSPGYVERELYRWQQLDGWQIDKACGRFVG